MVEITTYEESILRVLLKSRHSLTAGAIAKSSGLSWNTVDKYLHIMEDKGWVRNLSGYWRAIVKEEYLE